jgi:chorismate mutase
VPTPAVRALRGATTVDEDTIQHVGVRVRELVSAMLERNGVDKDELISIIFTATDDVVSVFPATAARELGLGDVPLLCARELSVVGGTPRCIRVLMHLTTTHRRQDLHHVYLEGARGLRDDLPD